MRSLFFGDISGDQVHLTGAEGHHAADVMRLGVGEMIDVSDNAGGLASVRVTSVGRGEVRADVVERHVIPPARPQICVAQALIKGEGMTDAIDLMVQVGVHRVIPWQAERSIAQWRDGREAKAMDRLRSAAWSAAKQARRPLVPTIDAPVSTAALITSLPAFDFVAVLHEQAREPLAGVDLARVERALLIIGPEGGIAPSELEQFAAAAAPSFRLGSSVIRSAQAGAIASTVLLAASAWR